MFFNVINYFKNIWNMLYWYHHHHHKCESKLLDIPRHNSNIANLNYFTTLNRKILKLNGFWLPKMHKYTMEQETWTGKPTIYVDETNTQT